MDAEKKNYRVLLSQKEFLKLLFANVISRFGDSLDAIAYSWIMYEVTGSESLMALIIGINYVPTVILQPFAGVLADRMKKKGLMVITDAIRFFIVAMFVSLYSAGLLTPLIIAVLTVLTSTVEAFRMPAGTALMPTILSQDYYTVGQAASFSLSRAAQMIGYVCAGGLIAVIGSAGVLWIDAVTFLISAVIIAFIRSNEIAKKGKLSFGGIFGDIKGGFGFLKKSRTVKLVCMIGVVINFGLMPLTVFQTPYVEDYLGMGAETLSYIKVLMFAGMMVGAAVAPKLMGKNGQKSTLCLLSGIGMGASIILMFFTPIAENIPLKLILLTFSMFFVGFGGGILNVIIGSCLMQTVPKDILGRVGALNSAVMEASMPIGSFLCSALVIGLSVTQLLLMFGALTVIFYAAMAAAGVLTSLDKKE